ncbi:hypothetical protein [Mesorhizobium sp.]|uniref:non-homologous end-joining DNA ligase LigD n=1 Tax=Mesorhizobium sp. TaxID=1871066 RepID=UPI003455152E
MAKSLAQCLVDADPDRYLLPSAPAVRKGRILIDYLRNGRDNTAVGAFSPRARLGLPTPHPVTWMQVERGIRPDSFTIDYPFKPVVKNAA